MTHASEQQTDCLSPNNSYTASNGAAQTGHWSFAVFLGLILAASFLAQIKVSVQGIRFLLDHAVLDDTFYYLQWAWNITNGLGPTVDGISPTNGVQPLWSLLCIVFAEISSDKSELIRTTLIACAVFNLGTGILLARLGYRLGARTGALLCVVFFTLFMARTRMVLNGMEISLLMCLFAAYLNWLASMVTRWDRGQPVGPWYIALGGLLVSLLFLVRVDAGIYIVPILGFFLLGMHSRTAPRIKPVLVASGVLAATVIGLAATNWLVFGTPSLTSGQVKTLDHYQNQVAPVGGFMSLAYLTETVELWGVIVRRVLVSVTLPEVWKDVLRLNLYAVAGIVSPFLAFMAGYIFWPARSFFMGTGEEKEQTAPIGGIERIGNPRRIAWLSIVLWVVVVALCALFIFTMPVTGRYLAALFVAGLCLCELVLGGALAFGASQVCVRGRHVALMLWITAVTRIWIIAYLIGRYFWCNWYYGPEYILVIVTVGLGLDKLLTRVGLRPLSRSIVYVFAGAVLLFVAWYPLVSALASPDRYDRLNSHQLRYDLARYVEATTPPDTILAASNAGELGYFSNRTFVNLEGLVSSREILKLRRSERPITQYLDKVGVQMVLDYESLPPGETESTAEEFYWIPRDRLKQIKQWPLHLPDETMVFRLFKYLPASSDSSGEQKPKKQGS